MHCLAQTKWIACVVGIQLSFLPGVAGIQVVSLAVCFALGAWMAVGMHLDLLQRPYYPQLYLSSFNEGAAAACRRQAHACTTSYNHIACIYIYIIIIIMFIPHCHGNGLVISGVHSQYMRNYLMGSRIYTTGSWIYT